MKISAKYAPKEFAILGKINYLCERVLPFLMATYAEI